MRQVAPDSRYLVLDAFQRARERRCHPRVIAHHRQFLVGHEFGLHDHAGRAVENLDFVFDSQDGALWQRNHPRTTDSDAAVARRAPLHLPVQQAGPEVQDPLMVHQPPVAQVE